MPDAHESAWVPNGIVVATQGLIYPRLVGSDIGCGVAAISFEAEASQFSKANWTEVLGALQKRIPILKQPSHHVGSNLPETCAPDLLSHPSLIAAAKRDGRYQLGTLGGGNHFVELQKDQDGRLWAMVHSGSRAMGQLVTDFHLARAEKTGMNGLHCLDLSRAEGKAYLQDMNWAVAYAGENRLSMINRVADILEAGWGIHAVEASYLDCPHNFARREWHHGESWMVHRKSANSAFLGEPGLIPGSMGTESRIVKGLGHPESLCSSAHGAGRRLSRNKARKAIGRKDLERSLAGIVFDLNQADSLREEGPRAYKDLGKVMEAQIDLVKTTQVLKPLCVHKGGT